MTRNTRLAYRQFVAVIAIALALGFVLGTVQVGLDYQDQRTRIEADITEVAESVRGSAANALWTLNADLALAVARGLLGNPTIVSASVIAEGGYVLALETAPRREPRYRKLAETLFGPERVKSIDITYVDNGTRHDIGALRIVIDPYPLAEQFLQRAAVTFLSGLVKGAILSIAVFAAFVFTTTRPLARLAAQIDAINPIKSNQAAVSVDARDSENELGRIASTVNEQMNTIRNHIDRLEAAETSVSHMNARLERTVAVRTAELTREIDARAEVERRLRLAVEEAQRNANTRAQFLANMSHELRTPLNAIIGFTEASSHFLHQKDHERVSEYLVYIGQAGGQLLDLVNAILDLSRVDSGKVSLDLENVDLSEIFTEVKLQLSPLIEENGNTVSEFIDPHVSKIRCDRMRLRQILLNLVGNAAKFTSGGTIRLETGRRPNRPGMGFISVSDTGIGIAPEHLPTIFDRYSQDDAMVAKSGGGFGLGLMIVQSNCNLFGWTVTAESTPGEGSTFMVEIAMNYVEAATDGADIALGGRAS